MDHRRRAKEILEKVPEIKRLYGPDWTSAPMALSAASMHLALALHASGMSTAMWFASAYLVGAALAQFGFLAIHELAHNLFFSSAAANKLFSIVINLPLLFPFAIVFRTYHLLHHAHQGGDLDFDLPSELEIALFRGRLGKFVWLACQLVFYALRPCFLHPVGLCPYSALNVAVQAAFNACVICFFGFAPVKFLFASLLFAGGLHPCSGHFLSEHVQFKPGGTQDTFSYYGPLNAITWNVGFHVEHHDFTRVSWRRLPSVRKLAGESYEGLAVCESWPGALVRFVWDPRLSLGNCRARR